MIAGMKKNKLILLPKEHYPKPNELPGNVRFMAEQIERHFPGEGVHHAIILAQVFGKTGFYVSRIDNILMKMRNDRIRADYDKGKTVRELAAQYRLSFSRLFRILTDPES